MKKGNIRRAREMLAQARDAVLVSVGQTDKTDPEEPGTTAQEVSGFEKARIS